MRIPQRKHSSAAKRTNAGFKLLAFGLSPGYNRSEEAQMDVYIATIRDLPAVDKLRLVERIWDDLAASVGPIPLPEWAVKEATRRREEMRADPNLGCTHEAVWKQIDDSRNG